MNAEKKPAQFGDCSAGTKIETTSISQDSKVITGSCQDNNPFIDNISVDNSAVSKCGIVGNSESRMVVNDEPPYTKRGVDTSQRPLMSGKIHGLQAVGYDWLTISSGSDMSRWLVQNTTLHEKFGKHQGFEEKEERNCFGGSCQRRLSPIGESAEFGRDYESWVFSSSLSDHYVRTLSASKLPCKPTRIDIAFDFSCDDDFYPCDFIDLHRKHIEQKAGLKVETSGPELEGTRYVGSRRSDRFLRIYRKDLEDDQVAMKYGATMRFELQVQNGSDYCRGIWQSLQNCGYDISLCLASSHIGMMTGFRPLPDGVEIPKFEKKMSAAGLSKMSQFFNQYGPTVNVMLNLGVDLDTLSSLCAENLSRNSISKMKRFEESMSELSPDEINDILASLINFKHEGKSNF